ncbi:DUF4296 domain-containing protein [Lacihabitans sp. LS3-19]|uniref:DUF4296 domain-containing protein n=1 Tax=Lacihabitans sp. LS3-19 TaxID=2487335 RepID=UPI00286E70E4|nr:DUF4296 domain-containing protein [Lacihabitans sp. LS3-19]
MIWMLSCNSSNEKVIDKTKMSIVFAELKLAESQVSRLNFMGADSAKVAFKYLEKEIYKKHKIDSLQYLNSFDFYAKDKKELLKIYEGAEAIIEKKKNKKNPV